MLYIALGVTLLFSFWDEFGRKIFFSHFFSFSILYLFWLAVFYIFGLYELNIIKARLAFYPRIAGGLLACLVLGMIFFYLIPLFGITPKTNLVINILIFGALITAWRKLFYFLFASHFLTRLAIFGDNAKIEKLTKEIINRPYLGYKLVKIDENKNLISQIKEGNIDTLIITENLKSDHQTLQKLYSCLPARINFFDYSRAYEVISEKIPVDFIDLSWFLENLKEGEKLFYDKIKRIMDLILAGFTLILSAPLWPFIALIIKLEDGGPVFYRQERIGKDRKPFLLVKFRSMRPGAEDGTGPIWAKKEDSRTTKIGGVLRKTHLDELPQMLNVLRGEISLVGPRPERPEFVEELEKEIPHYHLRHLIKPGFTGWAQIKFRYGRSIMDSKEKFEYDLYYLKNRNFLLDFGILLKTFRLFFKRD